MQRIAVVLTVTSRRRRVAFHASAAKTVYTLAQKGQLPAFKVGGQWRFKRADIDAWIERQKAAQRSEDF